jgi:N-acyl-D-aspartate/D-glutamate deacylase
MQAESDEDYRQLLRDQSFRDSVRLELTQPAAVRLFNGEWDKLKVLEVSRPSHQHLEGQSLASLAKSSGQDPLDLMLDLALEEDLETTFLSVLLNADEAAVSKLLTHEYSAIALSDAGAHLTFFCDAGFGLHLLGHWVRDRKIMSLEQAIYRLTGQPSQIYGIVERGYIKQGAFADLMLFDPDTVGRSPARRVCDLPAGERRLTTDPLGVHGVWVNGTRIVDEGGLIDNAGRPGQVLRDFH